MGLFTRKKPEVFYKLPGADEKNLTSIERIPLVINVYHGIENRHYFQKDGKEYQFPNWIDKGYGFSRVIDVDSSGAIYVLYDQTTEPITLEGEDHPSFNVTF